jgi:hypothetical protein
MREVYDTQYKRTSAEDATDDVTKDDCIDTVKRQDATRRWVMGGRLGCEEGGCSKALYVSTAVLNTRRVQGANALHDGLNND